MSKKIYISRYCYLEKDETRGSYLIYNEIDPGDCPLLQTDAEFNRLAMEAPFVQRLIEYARMNYQGDERDYSIYELRQKLLTEIAELEKPA